MADFPTLRPSLRRYSMGAFPVTVETGFGGGNIRFLHGSTSFGSSLELTYQHLTESEAAQIRDHYRGQDGSHVAFLLPVDMWAGHTSYPYLMNGGTQWSYAEPPEEMHKDAGYVDMTVKLVSVI